MADSSGITLELLQPPGDYTPKQIDQAFRVAGAFQHRGRFLLLEPPKSR